MTIIPKEKEVIEKINEGIYCDLEMIIKKLNKRFNFKFYTIIFDEQDEYQYCLRVRKTLSKNLKVNQEKLQCVDNIFREVNLGNDNLPKIQEQGNRFIKEIKGYIDLNENVKKIFELQEDGEIVKASKDVELVMDEIAITNSGLNAVCYQVLYSNFFQIDINSKKFTLTYIIEIRNADEEIKDLFYKNPQYSFLRIILDNFFYDYYELNNGAELIINEKGNVNKRYNEEEVTFLRRLSRVFFGKVQSILKEGIKLDDEHIGTKDNEKVERCVFESFDNKIVNKYYISNLMEEIEDISNKTYEGANPFGSILFLGEDFKDENNKKIKYAVKFEERGRIKLGDSRRIRKLLEITNCEKELYLIANYHEILGIGGLSWNDLSEDAALVRLDFKGLSKYNLVYVHTKVKDYTVGKLVVEDGKKTYKCGKNLEIVENNLVTLIFKDPKLKEEEYSSEKFKRIFQAEFGEKEIKEKNYLNNDLEKIERVVRMAIEQKHGTMVVITEQETAKSELAALEAQSTLIVPREIESEYVKYLTSIDGAIYFDTKGQCHAIGVILDGIANEKIGDASRGSRYNSAYKYLEMLKTHNRNGEQDNNKKCVIVIISEDGMVDIIPDLENEDRIQSIVQEIIYIVSEENTEDEKKLKEFEEELMEYKNAIEHYLYFEIAEEFFNKKKNKNAIEYYKMGFDKAKEDSNSIIISRHYDLCARCYYNLKTNDGYEKSIEFYREASNRSNNLIENLNYYSDIMASYFHLGESHKKDGKNAEQKNYYSMALEYFKQYIKFSKDNNLQTKSYYINLASLCNFYLGIVETNKEIQANYFNKAIKEVTKAIKIEDDSTQYWNRAMFYVYTSSHEDALKDFICALILGSDDKDYINQIKKILNKNNDLAKEALEFYKKQLEVYKIEGIITLQNALEEYVTQMKIDKNVDVAKLGDEKLSVNSLKKN